MVEKIKKISLTFIRLLGFVIYFFVVFILHIQLTFLLTDILHLQLDSVTHAFYWTFQPAILYPYLIHIIFPLLIIFVFLLNKRFQLSTWRNLLISTLIIFLTHVLILLMVPKYNILGYESCNRLYNLQCQKYHCQSLNVDSIPTDKYGSINDFIKNNGRPVSRSTSLKLSNDYEYSNYEYSNTYASGCVLITDNQGNVVKIALSMILF